MITDETAKDTLVQYLENTNKKLLARWDAGGDEQFCYVFPEGTKAFETKGILGEAFEYLAQSIIDTLDLPDAGEYYHNGEGIIRLGHKKSIGLVFTSKEVASTYEEAYYSETEPLATPIPKKKIYQLDDPFNLAEYMQRLSLNIGGYTGQDWTPNAYSHLNVINGDQLPNHQEIEMHYRLKMIDIIQEFIPPIKKFNQEMTRHEIQGIDVGGNLNPDFSIEFEIHTSLYTIVVEHNNTWMTLIR